MAHTIKNLKTKADRSSWQPVRLNPSAPDFKKQIAVLSRKHPEMQIVDEIVELTEELFLLRNPRFRFDKEYKEHLKQFRNKLYKDKPSENFGSWFYYPWSNMLIHFLPEAMHQEMRTGRNRFLITESEQKKFYGATIGIMGMSVGSHVALTIVMTGGAKHIKLADLDTISGSNLNRIRTGYQNIGANKAIVVARQVYEFDPYAQVELFPNGVDENNLEKFLVGKKKLNVLVEEMDNPYLKIKVRYSARKHKIPVIMAADNGDNVIVDVERYDLHKNLPILHGIIGKMTAEEFKEVAPQDLPRTIARIAGANLSTVRMLESVTQVGRKIYSWPQLGTAATLCGSVLAYLARQVVLGEKIKEGRFDVKVDGFFTFLSQKEEKEKKIILKKLGLGK